jgi:diaminohydroxyphosphoribosylaminopyrimidine deaminase/5-amino-6-(5-phosphoribosylamino)uracil reductase
MIGIGTAIADDPMLTCRLPGMAKSSPVRIVLDSMLRLPVGSRLVASARETPVWTVSGVQAPADAETILRAHGVEVLRSPASASRVELKDAIELLAGKGVTRLMVEGGPALAAALIAADLVDAAVLFHSPKIVGADGVDALATATTEALTGRLKQVASEPVGADRQDVYERG